MAVPVESPGPGVLVVGAGLIIDQHHAGRGSWKPGTCRRCTQDGCPLLDEAQRILESYRAERGPLFGSQQ